MIRSDRRASSGHVLAEAFLAADGPLCFDDLVEMSPGNDVREVSEWLGHAVHEGLIEEVRSGTEAPSRCFRLRSRGRRVLTLRRRSAA